MAFDDEGGGSFGSDTTGQYGGLSWGGDSNTGGNTAPTVAEMFSDAMQGKAPETINVPGLYDISNPEDFATMQMLGWDPKEAPQIGQSQLEGRMAGKEPPGLFSGLSWRDIPIVNSIYDILSPFNPFPGPQKGLGAKGLSTLGGGATGFLTGGASTAVKGLGIAGKASRAASNVMGGMSVPEAALRGTVPDVAFDLANMLSNAMRGVPAPFGVRQEDYPYQDIGRLNQMQLDYSKSR